MNRKIFSGTALALISVALVPLSVSSASAADSDPAGTLLGGAKTILQPITKPAPAPAKTAVVTPPAAPGGDTSPGNTTTPPKAPDHGSSQGILAKLGTSEVAGQGSNDATINDDDSTKADSTLLSLGGNEVLGTHADSKGTQESHFDPLAPITTPICDGSSGGACVDVLYADAYATDDGSKSHAQSRSGIASACIGGTSTVRGAPCDGLVGTGVATSEGNADRNQKTGQTTANSSYKTAGVCVKKTLLGCSVGVDALESHGAADSGPTPQSTGTATRSSSLAGVALGGMTVVGPITDPMDLSIQPACATPSLLCVFLNQGESYLGPGIAGTVQDALKATVLPGALDLFAGVGHTETLVHNDGGNKPPNPPPNPKPKPKDHPDGPDGPDDNSVLPDTGGLEAGLLALGLLGIAAGSFAVAAGRRERITLG